MKSIFADASCAHTVILCLVYANVDVDVLLVLNPKRESRANIVHSHNARQQNSFLSNTTIEFMCINLFSFSFTRSPLRMLTIARRECEQKMCVWMFKLISTCEQMPNWFSPIRSSASVLCCYTKMKWLFLLFLSHCLNQAHTHVEENRNKTAEETIAKERIQMLIEVNRLHFKHLIKWRSPFISPQMHHF